MSIDVHEKAVELARNRRVPFTMPSSPPPRSCWDALRLVTEDMQHGGNLGGLLIENPFVSGWRPEKARQASPLPFGDHRRTVAKPDMSRNAVLKFFPLARNNRTPLSPNTALDAREPLKPGALPMAPSGGALCDAEEKIGDRRVGKRDDEAHQRDEAHVIAAAGRYQTREIASASFTGGNSPGVNPTSG